MTTNKLMHKMYESATFLRKQGYISVQPGYHPLRKKLEHTFFNMRRV